MTFLAPLLRLPEKTLQVLGRAMREVEYVHSSGRGRNAHRLTHLEVARILIAVMVSESTTTGVERLPHFAALPLKAKSNQNTTFEVAFAHLLKRYAEGEARTWYVEIDIGMSEAKIGTQLWEEGFGHEEHVFGLDFDDEDFKLASDDYPLPYLCSIQRKSLIHGSTLKAISRRVFADGEVN
ncbi:hypothetical protein ACN2XU_14440 [Primorskyibacter sp. 2E107]|uniref:hypothetical protein n=1 Tax=Primorskyibacter sp. 2E107 TaxID=3403458 RepID=UPI003AF44EFB